MKKYEIIKSNVEFNNILNQNNKISNSELIIFSAASENAKPRFGISAPKKLGNAVVRNKCKRQLRQLLDETKIMFKNNRNYIIIIKKGFLTSNFENKLANLKKLIGGINEEK